MNHPEPLPPELAALESQLTQQAQSGLEHAEPLTETTIEYWIQIGRQRQIAEQTSAIENRDGGKSYWQSVALPLATHLTTAAATALAVFGLSLQLSSSTENPASLETVMKTDSVHTDDIGSDRKVADSIPSQRAETPLPTDATRNQTARVSLTNFSVPLTEAGLDRLLNRKQQLAGQMKANNLRSTLAPINFEALKSQNSIWSLQQKLLSSTE